MSSRKFSLLFGLKREVVYSSEMSAYFYQTSYHHIPEDDSQNIKCHMNYTFLRPNLVELNILHSIIGTDVLSVLIGLISGNNIRV
jgi:hypothetical protein